MDDFGQSIGFVRPRVHPLIMIHKFGNWFGAQKDSTSDHSHLQILCVRLWWISSISKVYHSINPATPRKDRENN